MSGIKISELSVGEALPERSYTATNVSLFLYNAAIWNPHRIHYDEPYTTNVENHPGVVIDGPLQGDWLNQVVVNWTGDCATLISFNYSNRRASYLGETLTSGGAITAIDTESGNVDLEIFIKNQDGDVITPGTAQVRF
tara:strand:+ start:134 stop:547 length:414 start_codon:yes stop_codon:yes gene_type:complete